MTKGTTSVAGIKIPSTGPGFPGCDRLAPARSVRTIACSFLVHVVCGGAFRPPGGRDGGAMGLELSLRASQGVAHGVDNAV